MLQSGVGVGVEKHLSEVRIHSTIKSRPLTVMVHVPVRKGRSIAPSEISREMGENRIHVTQHFGVAYTEDEDPEAAFSVPSGLSSA